MESINPRRDVGYLNVLNFVIPLNFGTDFDFFDRRKNKNDIFFLYSKKFLTNSTFFATSLTTPINLDTYLTNESNEERTDNERKK